tara:strand:+ start:401 stop:766 length:366 start_codon:yes stop_codon:yes gene_type:complete
MNPYGSNKTLKTVDQNRVSNIESSVYNMSSKLKKKYRAKQFIEWAKQDYGLDNALKIKNKSNKQKDEVLTEVDFIFRIKEKYIHNTNHQAAVTIQSILKAKLMRIRYLKMRDFVVWNVIKL